MTCQFPPLYYMHEYDRKKCKYSANTGCGKGDLILEGVLKGGHLVEEGSRWLDAGNKETV
jgi:hypothetical protein